MIPRDAIVAHEARLLEEIEKNRQLLELLKQQSLEIQEFLKKAHRKMELDLQRDPPKRSTQD